MKILQLSDLHLGKRLKEYNLIEDQTYVLDEALQAAQDEKVDAIFLCGDIYDTTVPTAEATALFDSFLTKIHKLHLPCFIISGNHDSADKLHFGSSIFKDEGIHVVTKVEESLTPIHLLDAEIYLLPFIRPLDVNCAFGTEYKTYSEAISEVIKRMNVDPAKTDILLAHQMVVPLDGKLPIGGSEEIIAEDGVAVGDVAAVSTSIFAPFDYVALGHIHKPQNVAKNMRYAGSILKYHRDEANIDKSFTIIEAKNKNISVKTLPIHFLHDVIKLQGTLDEILAMDADKNAYVFASLTDKVLLDDPMAKLKVKFPYAAWVDYVSREVVSPEIKAIDVEHVQKDKLFFDFYKAQTGDDITEEQKKLVTDYLINGEDKQ